MLDDRTEELLYLLGIFRYYHTSFIVIVFQITVHDDYNEGTLGFTRMAAFSHSLCSYHAASATSSYTTAS